MTEVKNTCPLFRQRGLTVDKKVKNLESLINSQLDFNLLADIEDLESVIIASEIKEVNVDVRLDTEHDDMVSDGESSKKKEISWTKEGSKRKKVLHYYQSNSRNQMP